MITLSRRPESVLTLALVIARMWRGWVAADRAAEYVAYIEATGLAGYRTTPGNLGAQMWTRYVGNGRAEVVTVSWWESWTSIKGFSGADSYRAVFYPRDDEFLVDRETTVSHFEVAAGGPVS
jgi:heme-degrading monooxygenase HmoA